MGWPEAKPVRLLLDDGMGGTKQAWVVEAAKGKYLRDDGYVK